MWTTLDVGRWAWAKLSRMTTVLPTLAERDDCVPILSEILRRGRACPGITLVGMLDLDTGAVLSVRRLETPEPLPDDACDVPGELFMLMSPILRALAVDLVGPGGELPLGRLPDRELVTVVCREGAPEIGDVEAQFFWGWRYSNDLTGALSGDVYAVTPDGWVGLHGGSGALPVLVGDAAAPEDELVRFPELAERRALLVDPGVRAAAAVLAETALAEMVPEPGECLLCYEARLIHVLGCDRTLRIAQRFRDCTAPRATGLERRLASMGAACDCQLVEAYGLWGPFAVFEEAAYVAAVAAGDPEPVELGCCGVRKGSTQPCAKWGHRRLKRG